MRMQAALLNGLNQPLSVEEVELDAPQEGEVLVKMAATGVCHSDVHVITGDLPHPLPVILGHEGAGVVQQVGPGVEDLQPGDPVVMTFLPACGKCRWCHTGQPNMCDLGANLLDGNMLDGSCRLRRLSGEELKSWLFISTWAEYTVCPVASVVKAPKEVDLGRVCLLGCGFTTGYGAATSAVHIRPGESALIVGCGGLGLSAIQGARASGAGKIIAVDLHEEKLAMARHAGATHTIRNTHDLQAITDKVMEITWGVGADYTFEFVGMGQTDESIKIAFKTLRKGGTCVICGVGSVKLDTLPVSPSELTHLRKRVKGVLFGDTQFRYDLPRYMQMYQNGNIDLEGLATHEFRLEDINTCVQNLLSENKVARQIIRF